MLADKIRINQITLNLISNAIKYTPPGGTVTYISHSRNLPEDRMLFSFEIKEAVYSSTGTMLMNQRSMSAAKQMLSYHPTVPTRGITLIKAVVDNKIMSWCPWAKTGYTERSILTHFRPNITPETIIDDIEVLLTETISRLSEFVGDDVWNYYFIKFVGYDLVVEKGQDHRLCEWYEKKLSGEW